MSKIDLAEQHDLKKAVPEFGVGDEVKVHLKVLEGDKTRIQIFEGIVIRKRGRGTGATFTVLRDARGDVVEKVFAVHSPRVEKVTVTRKRATHRAKLYHLRNKRSSA